MDPLRVVTREHISENIERITTESEQYGRVTQTVLVLNEEPVADYIDPTPYTWDIDIFEAENAVKEYLAPNQGTAKALRDADAGMMTTEDRAYLESIADISARIRPHEEVAEMARGCPDHDRYANEESWDFSPISTASVYTSNPPFSEIAHLLSGKPLHRPRRPNAKTREVLRDADAGIGLTRYPSVEAMFEDLED